MVNPCYKPLPSCSNGRFELEDLFNVIRQTVIEVKELNTLCNHPLREAHTTVVLRNVYGAETKHFCRKSEASIREHTDWRKADLATALMFI